MQTSELFTGRADQLKDRLAVLIADSKTIVIVTKCQGNQYVIVYST